MVLKYKMQWNELLAHALNHAPPYIIEKQTHFQIKIM